MKSPIRGSVRHVVRKLFLPALVLAVCSAGLASNEFTIWMEVGEGSSRAPKLVPASSLAQAAMSDEEKIRDAMSAGPASIAENAAILEWPSESGGAFRILREGTNGWWCIASTPAAASGALQDPTCDDEVWQEYDAAFVEGREPNIERIGIAYMLSGDAGLSNTDPFATGPTDDNEWHVSGPHVMILMPNMNYEGVSTDPHNGGPYVMWAGTPYAHIMVPIESHTQD